MRIYVKGNLYTTTGGRVHIYNVDGDFITKFRQFTDTHILHQSLT